MIEFIKKYANNIKSFLIVILSLLLISVTIVLTNQKETIKSDFAAYKKNGDYITQYQSQTIHNLKKEKKELYDSIKNVKNVKQAAIIDYKYIYVGDTTQGSGKPEKPLLKDSTYTFFKNSDTLSYNIKINAPYVNWYLLKFILNDKLTIINRESAGSNETSISTASGGGTITNVEMFNKKDNKNSFLNRFTFGPQIGVGVGVITKTPDIYVGFGITYRLNKIK